MACPTDNENGQSSVVGWVDCCLSIANWKSMRFEDYIINAGGDGAKLLQPLQCLVVVAKVDTFDGALRRKHFLLGENPHFRTRETTRW